MTDNELKKLIKEYVKQSLVEILAEKYMEKLMKEVVKKCVNTVQTVKPGRPKKIQEIKQEIVVEEQIVQPKQEVKQVQPQKVVNEQNNKVLKEEMLKKMGIENGIWKDIFEETAKSDNQILSEQRNKGVPVEQDGGPEQVPENILEKAGFMNKDWSKFGI